MNESVVTSVAVQWSQLLRKRGIHHVIIGSAAMLLHECRSNRKTFKDVDFLVPQDNLQELKNILVKDGFTQDKNGNYKKDDVSIEIATPKSHPGLPSPTDDSIGIEIGGARVLNLDGLIEAKKLAVESQMNRIASKGYKRCREKSAAKHLDDFFALCRARDEQMTRGQGNR